MAASIRDVAAQAGVSLATVSKVLNRRGHGAISPATCTRVEEAARSLDYHPSAVARGLAGRRMETIGVVLAYDQASITSDPYLGPCLDGILSVTKQRHQKTMLFTEDTWDDALKNLPTYCDGSCDGLLVVIPRMHCPVVAALRARQIPLVRIGDSHPEGEDSWADVDNEAGARRAVEFLIAQGHRRIAAFLGNRDFFSNDQRLEGYRKALANAGIALDSRLLFDGSYHTIDGERNLHRLRARLPGTDRPTAVFCLCDSIAVGALQACAEIGICVPEDLSVIGFDDSTLARRLAPGLTTMRHSIGDVGRRATELLLGRIQRTIAPGTSCLLPPELIVRATVAPPR
jgi:LacI family transcriptional regulator